MPLVRLDNYQPFQVVNVLSDPGAVGGPKVIPSCAEIKLHFVTDAGMNAFCVLYGRYAGAFSGSTAQANAIFAALKNGAPWTTLNGFLAPGTFFNGVRLRDVNTPFNPEISSDTAGSVGTSSGTPLPVEVAAVVTLRTAKAGPSGRGRFYVPNWATNALGTGNTMAAAAVTALQNWATTNVRSAFSASGYTMVLGLPARQAYTGSTGTQHPARSATSVDVTALVVRDNHWDSQRRRGLR